MAYVVALGALLATLLTSVGVGTADATTGVITAPVDGTTLNCGPVVLTWDGPQVGYYAIHAGSQPGGAEYILASAGTNLSSFTMTGLPEDGSTIYVRLWHYNSGWTAVDEVEYTACDSSVMQITAPTPGSVLACGAMHLHWSGPATGNYAVHVGSYHTGSNYAQVSAGSNRSITITNVPDDGTTVYVRLWHLADGGTWQLKDETQYTACGLFMPASITSPAPGSVLPCGTVNLTWDGPLDAIYTIHVGSQPGGGDIILESAGAAATSYAMEGLPEDGSTLYVRLWRFPIGGVEWILDDSTTYTACTPDVTPPQWLDAAPEAVLSSLTRWEFTIEWPLVDEPASFLVEMENLTTGGITQTVRTSTDTYPFTISTFDLAWSAGDRIKVTVTAIDVSGNASIPLEIYPIPIPGLITVQADTLQELDAAGNVVSTMGVANACIPTSCDNSGIWLSTAATSSDEYCFRLISVQEDGGLFSGFDLQSFTSTVCAQGSIITSVDHFSSFCLDTRILGSATSPVALEAGALPSSEYEAVATCFTEDAAEIELAIGLAQGKIKANVGVLEFLAMSHSFEISSSVTGVEWQRRAFGGSLALEGTGGA